MSEHDEPARPAVDEPSAASPHPTPPESDPSAVGDYYPGNEERTLALIAHLSGIAGIVGGGFLGFVGPLIVYLWKGESSPYVSAQAKEALNFQITLFLIATVCALLTAVTCGALFLLLFVPMVLQVIFGIIAALAVRDGKDYRYPFNWRLVR